MKATETKLIGFLKNAPQFVIPIYQRTYSWTEKECRQLWDDVIRTGKNDKLTDHFVGSIVYIQRGQSNQTIQEPLLVIDGQQRLTTLTLLLAALANAIAKESENNQEPVESFSPRKIRNYFLLNPEEDGERHYKLLLSQTDKSSLIAILNGSEQPKEHSLRVKQNFELFTSLLANTPDLKVVCNGISKLMIVDVALTRDQDNPQLIFESMNSTGKELSQADLIRNFVLMGLEPTLQTRLYEQYWRPMELDFGQEAYGTHFDAFMRHYLTVKTGEIPRLKEIYDAFKAHSRSLEVAELGIEELVKDVRHFAHYFCAMALGAETDAELKLAFHDLRELKVDVAYPFLLELYHDYSIGTLLQAEFFKVVRLIESYVFRRAIYAIPTNSMNKTFSTFTKSLRKGSYLESVEAHFMLLPSYRRFPRDEEFKRDIKTRDLYNFRSRTYWLRRMENFGRKERVVVDEYTIEHIMPQNENLSSQWKEDLGQDWQTVQQMWLHTLGNLTLTAYNSEYSDQAFKDKRDMDGGFKVSPLKLNAGLGQLPKWDEEQVKIRAATLSQTALKVWQSPVVDEETLESYRSEKKAGTGYSIQDHSNLVSATVGPLFESFRKQVLDLNPCVTEEFLKLYVAYKAETNFVDVVPQSKRLRLSINIDHHEMNDPRGIAKDVSNLGRWGNGDVEVFLNTREELPYIIGLVRQAFEKQMGNSFED